MSVMVNMYQSGYVNTFEIKIALLTNLLGFSCGTDTQIIFAARYQLIFLENGLEYTLEKDDQTLEDFN